MKPDPKHPETIQKMFGSIAKDYDRANNWITFYMHHLWRKRLLHWSGAQEGDRVLDCATGTGDLAFDFKAAVGTTGEVIGSDFCEEMLELAEEKAKKKNLKVQFEQADLMDLPYSDNQFDVLSVGYGLRNTLDPEKAISEMARVLRPGGVLMILETGEPELPGLATIMDLYKKHLLPRLGGWATGHRDAYEYLNNSSTKFPSGQEMVQKIEKSGPFQSVECESLMAGASYLYKARKKSHISN